MLISHVLAGNLMEYIKVIHVTCAILTGVSFFCRGLLLITESPLWQNRWVRIIPHLIDTLLLCSAIGLLLLAGYGNPFHYPWLSGKILALCLYIALGMMAFRFARSVKERIFFWLAALVVLLHIYAFAITKSLLYERLLM